MKVSPNLNIPLSGSSVAKNTIYNLLGYGIPLIFAVILIPLLISGLGEERFGILSLAWIIIGYFSFFDFGIGRAITQIIAAKIGTNHTEEIPRIFWTSFFLMLFFSFIGATVLFFLAPTLIYNSFKLSRSIQYETLIAFYLLIFSIPIVTTTAGLRGVLEAYQKFAIINIIRTFLGVFSFLVPVLCLVFTKSLFWIVLFLVGIRIIVWILYLGQCFKLNISLRNELNFQLSFVKPILKLSGWMTVSNVMTPIIVYLDRFLIGALVSVAAITYYSTPYEIISKLQFIPGAITGVLFPAISSSYLSKPEFARKLTTKAVKYIFIFLYPIVLIIIVFAQEGLGLWLGEKFARNSTLILQLMSAGVLFNSLAYIPVTFLQGIGRADYTSKIYLIELPIYISLMWIAIENYGINGAALTWLCRMVIDAIIFFWIAKRQIAVQLKFNFGYIILIFLTVVAPFIVLIQDTYLKLTLIFIFIIVFAVISWRFLLSIEDKTLIISQIKRS